jgi:hypothetical protein
MITSRKLVLLVYKAYWEKSPRNKQQPRKPDIKREDKKIKPEEK